MQIFIANISMQNLGKTPAMLRNFRGQFQICPHPPSELIDYPVKENDIPKGLAIGAGMERIEPISILLNDANREDILDQRNGLWACGEVTYEDILGKVHITGFCWFCRAVGEVSYTIHPSPLNRRITLSDTNSESA